MGGESNELYARRRWLQILQGMGAGEGCAAAMLSCLVPTLLFPQDSLILFQTLHSENVAGANEQQSTAVQAAVVSLRMWNGVFGPLWMRPCCHSPEQAHQGTALPQPQEFP